MYFVYVMFYTSQGRLAVVPGRAQEVLGRGSVAGWWWTLLTPGSRGATSNS